jgi:hypothetical protein
MLKIKFKLILVGLILFSTGHLSAQDWGFKAGMNLSTIRTSYEDLKSASRPGWHAGVFSSVGDDAWQFQIEGMLSCLGAKVETSSEVTTSRVLYIQIPLFVKYAVNDWLNFQLGMYTGFRIHGSRKLTVTASNTTEKSNITDQVAFFDYGPVGGVGFKPFDQWGFEVKYNYGIPNFNANSNVNEKLYNQFWQISALFYMK